jgi:hypothetical protein
MPGAAHRTLVPAIAFAVTLGLAAWMTAGARDDPTESLRRAVAAYHRALQRGDAQEAQRFVPDGARRPREEQAERVAAWRGTMQWAVEALKVEPDGGTGAVVVLRLQRAGERGPGVVVSEGEAWRREGEGAWGIVTWEEVRRVPAGGPPGPRVELPPGGR